ncbi:MAG: hypothetical protein M1831_002084 [Alyxoria varia]|nr:MAG: hypothetical protein M1831_002084 [Alyxoria varia]
MAAWNALELPSYRQHNLLVEFASLKHIQLQGIYVSLTQGDASLWHGVLFVRKGPYAPAILRFRISFALGYPLVPPTVSFTSDPFHPLISPLTTASYSTRLSDDDHDHTNAEQKLPPGGFSLKHGFPGWFQKRSAEPDFDLYSNQSSEADNPLKQHASTSVEQSQKIHEVANRIHVVDVLRYVRSSFENESMIDSIPIDAAGNPGAWYAWRAYRNKVLKKAGKVAPDADVGESSEDKRQQDLAPGSAPQPTSNRPRGPSEWNWEGVWEERVKKVVQGSLSEPSLFGVGPARDDEIHFANYQPEEVGEIHTEMRQHLRILD